MTLRKLFHPQAAPLALFVQTFTCIYYALDKNIFGNINKKRGEDSKYVVLFDPIIYYTIHLCVHPKQMQNTPLLSLYTNLIANNYLCIKQFCGGSLEKMSACGCDGQVTVL